MATLKRPKMRKLPKAPKANASSAQLKNYIDKVNAVKKENAARLSAYEKEKRDRDRLRKMAMKIRETAKKF